MIRAGPHQRLRIWRPNDLRFVAIDFAELLQRLANFIGRPDFLAAGAVGNESDPLPVWRPARILLAPRSVGNALRLALVGGNGEDLAMDRDHRPAVRRRNMESFGIATDGDHFGVIVFGVGLHIDVDFGGLASCNIQFPQSEIVFVDNGLAVGGDAGEVKIAVGVVGNLNRIPALVRDLPNVVDALHHFRAAIGDVLFVGRAIADEVDVIVPAVHGP